MQQREIKIKDIINCLSNGKNIEFIKMTILIQVVLYWAVGFEISIFLEYEH